MRCRQCASCRHRLTHNMRGPKDCGQADDARFDSMGNCSKYWSIGAHWTKKYSAVDMGVAFTSGVVGGAFLVAVFAQYISPYLWL